MSPTTKSKDTASKGRTVSIVIEDPADVASVEALATDGFRTFQQEVRRIFTLALRRETRATDTSADSVSPKG